MIYFIQAGDKAVKIGFTRFDIKRRMKDLQIANYEKLKTIHLFKGNLATEAKLHFIAKKYHIRGEWFDKKVLKNRKIISIIKEQKKSKSIKKYSMETMAMKEEIQQGIEILLKDMKPEELALKLDVSSSSLNKYKAGKIDNPRWSILKKLRKMTGEGK